MSKEFKLIEKKFIEEEWRWTYELKIIFNKRKIAFITITDHYQQKLSREKITNELILELLTKLDGWRLEPIKYQGERKVYKWEIPCQEKKYRLIFWFKDKETSHLWIRNCYPIN